MNTFAITKARHLALHSESATGLDSELLALITKLPNIQIDYERARRVLCALHGASLDNDKLFGIIAKDTHAPQRVYIPEYVERGDLAHRQWLFFAVMTDRREVSEQVYKSHVALARDAPELYTSAAVHMSSKEIERILRKHKVGSPAQSAKYWPRSAKTLFSLFNGEPLDIYRRFGSVDAIIDWKKQDKDPLGGLPGFGPKILSLLAIFYEELGLMPIPEDAFPVDVHVQRFALAVGIAQGAGIFRNENAERVLRRVICAVIREEGLSTTELSHAIWLNGKHLCSACSRNASVPSMCSAYNDCLGPYKSTTYFRKGYWDLDVPRLSKGGTYQPVMF